MNKIKYIDWVEYTQQVINLSQEIPRIYTHLYGIPRGGLIPSVLLSHLLDIPIVTNLTYDLLCKSKILVIDDIVDSGKTLQDFKPGLDTAVLFIKEDVPCSLYPTYWCRSLGIVPKEVWIQFPYEVTTKDSVSKPQNILRR